MDVDRETERETDGQRQKDQFSTMNTDIQRHSDISYRHSEGLGIFVEHKFQFKDLHMQISMQTHLFELVIT